VRGALPVRNRALATILIRWLAFGRRPDWADVRALISQVDRADRHNAGEFRRELGRHERRTALAAFVDVPTMVLVGDRDRMTPPDHTRLIAATLPAAELVTYPGSGHSLPYERHADVATRILRLAGVAGHGTGANSVERRTRGGRVRRSTAPA
jgi:pimeloyl-ACP methyl ester carboxylesterase